MHASETTVQAGQLTSSGMGLLHELQELVQQSHRYAGSICFLFCHLQHRAAVTWEFTMYPCTTAGDSYMQSMN